MRIAITALAVLLVIPAAAGAQSCDEGTIPRTGMYYTSNGTLLPGRVSEAWCAGNPGQPGNQENAMSWDGTTLATQWWVHGMTIDAAGAGEADRYFDANGTGWIDYVTNYDGGVFWLEGNHFGSGPDLTGYLNYYNVNTRVSYVNGQKVGATSNVVFNGNFNECPYCIIEFVIANAMLVWTGEGDPGLPDYPGWECPEANAGELFDACCITARLDCPDATEETSWGAIKSLHR